MTAVEQAQGDYIRTVILERLRRWPDGLTMIEIARGTGLTHAETERGLNSLRRRKRVLRDVADIWMAV